MTVSLHPAHHIARVSTSQRLAQATQTATQENPTKRTVMELSHLTLYMAYARRARIHMTQTKTQDMEKTKTVTRKKDMGH